MAHVGMWLAALVENLDLVPVGKALRDVKSNRN